MKTPLMLAALAAAAVAMPALAQDGMTENAVEQAGVPLAVKDAAAQAWTLETKGRSICRVRLTAEPAGAGAYRAEVPADCGDALPVGISSWKPVTDGAGLLDGAGQVVVDFNRWSNSLLVSHRSSGVDLQLRRG
ncbi:MAG TPA: AprI/Inh family metalloprotease inhibitor [Caulobacteraceae bacterium]|nr:AprI/Inh family metalloprotease inhibitor [Caulobacteraceae bacterium]